MNFRAAHAIGSLALVAIVSGACSSTPPTARAFVDASLASGNAGQCNVADAAHFLVIGNNTVASNPVRINDGANQGGQVHISCTVRPTGASFAIALSAELSTPVISSGGSFTITGTVDAQGGQNIAATFNYARNTYTATDCTIVYDVQPANGPIAPGRIWGHLDCPNAQLSGSGTPVSCDASAEFVFENCAT